jgi:hypothetical protein
MVSHEENQYRSSGGKKIYGLLHERRHGQFKWNILLVVAKIKIIIFY